MGTRVQIGEGPNAKTVELGDEFKALTPDQQQATVNDVARQLGINPAAQATASDGVAENDGRKWRGAGMLPIDKEVTVDEKGHMTDTGEWRFNVMNTVNALLDPVKLPGEVLRGEVDPMSEQGFDRTMGLAMGGISPLRGAGIKKAATGEVISETVETVAKDKITGGTFREGLPEAPVGGKTDGTIKQTWTPDLVDQQLDAALAKLNETSAKRIPGKPADKFKHTLGDKPEKLPPAVSGHAKPSGIATFSMQQERVLQAEKAGTLTQKGGIGTPVGRITVPVSAVSGTVPVELKLRQAARFQTAASYAAKEQSETNIRNFQTQMENMMSLEGNKLTPAAAEAFAMSKNAIAQIDNMDSLYAFSHKLAEAANKNKKSTWYGKFFDVWMNWGLLSGLMTHATNIGSAAGVNLLSIVEHTASATAGKITRNGITYREAAARAYADFESIGEALFAAGKAFKTEKPLFDTGQLEYTPAIGGGFGRAVRVPGRALTAEDAFFKVLAFRQEINGLAVRNATAEGLKGRALKNRILELRSNPTDAMMHSSREFANKQTFTNGLGRHGRAVQNFLKEYPGFRLIIPFFRTPVNLLRYSAEHTVASFAMKKSRDNLLGRNGKAARDLAWTRMTMGTAVGAWVMHLAAQDLISGAGPSNDNEYRLKRADGWEPYSVRIGGHWYSYSRLEPFGTILGVAADAQTLYSEFTEAEAQDFAALLIGSIGNNLGSKTWLKGPADFSQVMLDPKRYGENYIASMLGTVIPAGVAQFARANDPYLREMRELIDGIKTRVPGERETLNVRRDPFGEPTRNEGSLGPDWLSPIYTRAAKDDPTIAEMLRLKTYPGRLSKSIEGVEMTPQEWDTYGSMAGKLTKTVTDALVSSPTYKDLPDEAKKTLMEDAISKSRNTARDTIKAAFPDLVMRIEITKMQKRLGGTGQASTPTP